MPKVSIANSAERFVSCESGKPEHTVFKRSWNADAYQMQQGHDSGQGQRRVLVVDSDRSAADNLGLLVSESGGTVMVAYGAPRAVEIAEKFQPDLVLVDLSVAASPRSRLADQLRARERGRAMKIVALAGHGLSRPFDVMNAEFDLILPRSMSQARIVELLSSLPDSNRDDSDASQADEYGRDEVSSLSNCESAFCDEVLKFQQDIFKTRSKGVRTKLVNDILIVRMPERTFDDADIAGCSSTGQTELPPQPRRLRRDVTYPVLEMLVQTIFGVRVRFMDHDVCESTGDEIIVIALSESPAGHPGTRTSRQPRFHKERRAATDGFECDEQSGAGFATDLSVAEADTRWTWDAES